METSVWVTGLQPPIDEEELAAFFNTKTEVSQIYVPDYDHSSECCVKFQNSRSVSRALNFDGHVLNGNVISVQLLNSEQRAKVQELGEERSDTDVKSLAETISGLSRDKLAELLTLVGSDTLLVKDNTFPNSTSRESFSDGHNDFSLRPLKRESTASGTRLDDEEYSHRLRDRDGPFSTESFTKHREYNHSDLKQELNVMPPRENPRNTERQWTPDLAAHTVPYGSMCRLSQFSGDDGKGEVPYQQWRHEVRSLIIEGYPNNSILLALRKSLKGTASDALLNLGEGVSPQAILRKFDASFGNILSTETLLEDFFSTSQRSSESVVSWSCRIESILARAQQKGAQIGNPDNVLRAKFYRGLRDFRLRDSIRHHFDNGAAFSQLLQSARQMEHELEVFKSKPLARSSAQEVDNDLGQKINTLTKLVESLNRRMDAMDRKRESSDRRPICFFCKEEGHIQRRCPNKPGNGDRPTPRGGR